MSYFIRKKHNNRGEYYTLVHAIYKPSIKNTIQKTKVLGYHDDFVKKYTDVETYLNEYVDNLNKKENEKKLIDDEPIPSISPIKNLGYFMIKDYYDALNINQIIDVLAQFNKISEKNKIKDSLKFLLYSRIINPGSILSNFKDDKNLYFDDFNITLDSLYFANRFIGANYKLVKDFLQEKVSSVYKYDYKNTYFDTTNYYFEIDRPSYKKQKGASKENRKEPIIGLGLLIDKNGIPIDYDTFPGNQDEIPVMQSILDNYREKYGRGNKIIRIADKGLNSGDNIADAIRHEDGYIFSKSVRKSDTELINWILDDQGYKETIKNNEVVYKIKSRETTVKIKVTDEKTSSKKETEIDQIQVVFYSKNFADKAKYERNKLIDKAIKETNSERRKSMLGQSYKYIKETRIDKEGNEINGSVVLSIDQDKIDEDSKLDGYYLIVTNQDDKTDEEIIDLYRGLWEIEESFRITKSELLARPAFISSDDGIEGHFFTCYLALLILRLIQKTKLKNTIGITSLLNTMRKYSCFKMDENKYCLIYNDENIPVLSKYYNLKLNQHFKNKKEIFEIFNHRKKAQDSKLKKI